MSKPNTTGGGGMNSQEAQQAQTIARIEMEIKLSRATMISHGEARAKKNVVALLEIVDSQAQKIAEARNEAKYWRDRAVGTLHPRDRGKVNTLPWVDGP